jgi:hypothetical protein
MNHVRFSEHVAAMRSTHESTESWAELPNWSERDRAGGSLVPWAQSQHWDDGADELNLHQLSDMPWDGR